MMPAFFWFAGIAGSLVALVSGPMGALMLWQRMAYFGDTLAHASLLGVALGTVWSLGHWGATLCVCLGVALCLRLLERQQRVAQDALLGLLSHMVLAVGIIVASTVQSVRLNIQGVLFGDILAVSATDIYSMLALTVVVGVGLRICWKPLLSATVSPALAACEGVAVGRVRTCYLLLLSLVIALAVKIVGVLLITALLIIPAAGARFASRSPESMACMASLYGIVSVWSGLALSWYLDWPAGPSIIVMASVCFFASLSQKR